MYLYVRCLLSITTKNIFIAYTINTCGDVALQIYTFLTSTLDAIMFHAQTDLTSKKGKPLIIEKFSCMGPRTGFGDETFSCHFLESNHDYSDIQL